MTSWHPVLPRTFCFNLSLQSGVVSTAAAGFVSTHVYAHGRSYSNVQIKDKWGGRGRGGGRV